MTDRLKALAVVTLVSETRTSHPFRLRHENDSYAHLSSLCSASGIDLYVAHFNNAIDDHSVLSWTHDGERWRCCELAAEEIAVAYADLPPNQPGANALRALLGSKGVTFVNDLKMNDALTDKLLTCELFPNLVPPTILASADDLPARVEHSGTLHADLRTDVVVVKPRYGERGKRVETLDRPALQDRVFDQGDDFIVQPLMESSGGIPELGISGRHDLRMMVFDGEVTDFFVRVAPADGFICNQSHGGRIAYFSPSALPPRFSEVARATDDVLEKYTPRYYSVDVGVGPSGKIWVYELNTMPGVVWNAAGSDKARYAGMHARIVEAIGSAARRGNP